MAFSIGQLSNGQFEVLLAWSKFMSGEKHKWRRLYLFLLYFRSF